MLRHRRIVFTPDVVRAQVLFGTTPFALARLIVADDSLHAVTHLEFIFPILTIIRALLGVSVHALVAGHTQHTTQSGRADVGAIFLPGETVHSVASLGRVTFADDLALRAGEVTTGVSGR